MKRLDIKDPNVWDTWRTLYPTLTDQEQFDFVNECERAYPKQIHHDTANFDFLFQQCAQPRVLEIGGWKGELAAHCLSRYPIVSWLNMDICQRAVDRTVPLDTGRYTAKVGEEFRWFRAPRIQDFDVCVSAHTIEHFSDEDFRLLVKHISGIKTVMFDAPLSVAGDSWQRYGGTHILRMGWIGVTAVMGTEGYSVEQVNPGCYLYRLA